MSYFTSTSAATRRTKAAISGLPAAARSSARERRRSGHGAILAVGSEAPGRRDGEGREGTCMRGRTWSAVSNGTSTRRSAHSHVGRRPRALLHRRAEPTPPRSACVSGPALSSSGRSPSHCSSEGLLGGPWGGAQHGRRPAEWKRRARPRGKGSLTPSRPMRRRHPRAEGTAPGPVPLLRAWPFARHGARRNSERVVGRRDTVARERSGAYFVIVIRLASTCEPASRRYT